MQGRGAEKGEEAEESTRDEEFRRAPTGGSCPLQARTRCTSTREGVSSLFDTIWLRTATFDQPCTAMPRLVQRNTAPVSVRCPCAFEPSPPFQVAEREKKGLVQGECLRESKSPMDRQRDRQNKTPVPFSFLFSGTFLPCAADVCRAAQALERP